MFLFCNEDKKKKERLITFLATDNKNCVLIDVGDNGVCGGFVHTE